jgi:hypothetical protein
MRHEDGLATRFANLPGDLLAALGLHVTQDDSCPRLCQGARYLCTYATCCASDGCHFATQVNHVVSIAPVGENHFSHLDFHASFVFPRSDVRSWIDVNDLFPVTLACNHLEQHFTE